MNLLVIIYVISLVLYGIFGLKCNEYGLNIKQFLVLLMITITVAMCRDLIYLFYLLK